MRYDTINYDQGHWLLAKMGKKVLRPGGRILTENMVERLNINNEKSVVEFAPGIGHTTRLALKNGPKQYFGVELNKKAAKDLEKKFKNENITIINKNAAQSDLEAASADVVFGEAMLTMQADHRKAEIIQEAHRLLAKGGLYGIHELSLQPDDINEGAKKEIQKTLAKAIRVNARPLTAKEWTALLENEGFEVIDIMHKPMLLLETKRLIEDEGFLRFLKITFNMLTHPKDKKRIQEMKGVFRKYNDQLGGIAIIAKKI